MAAWLLSAIDVILRRLKDTHDDDTATSSSKLFDLSDLPPELSLHILSNLNATDLCLAACVWSTLANDQLLWCTLRRSQWSYIHNNGCQGYGQDQQRLYMALDEGTVTFNADPFMGMDYFTKHHLVADNPTEIAMFFKHTRALKAEPMRMYLDARRDVLEQLIQLHNYRNDTLPRALRKLFKSFEAPNEHDNYLHTLLEKFSFQFVKCNPQMGLSADVVYLLCFSLIMLSVDLSSPHVKNKMSKREFIRNVRRAVSRSDDDFFGHLYDDVYVKGHIANNKA